MYASQLVPLRIVEVIDRAFRVYRDNFVVFVALVSVVIVPMAVINHVFTQQLQDALQEDPLFNYDPYGSESSYDFSFLDELLQFLVARGIAWFLQFIVIFSVISYMTSEYYLGRAPSLRGSVSNTIRRWIPLGMAVILYGIIFGFLSLVVGVVGSLCVIPYLAFYAVIYFGFCAFALLVPTIVLEDVGLLRGMGRSFGLGKIKFWRVFGFFLGVVIIMLVLQYAFQILSWMVLGAVGTDTNDIFNQEASLMNSFIGTSIQIFITPILPVGLTLMYYDVRIRTEGLDIALQTLDDPEPRPALVMSPDVNSVVTSQDFKNIFILIASSIGLTCGCCGFFYALGMMASV